MVFNITKLDLGEYHTEWGITVKGILDEVFDELSAWEPAGHVVNVEVTTVDMKQMITSGAAYTADKMEIWISFQYPGFDLEKLNLGLRQTLYHEFHHILRWLGPGYGETMFEAMVSEGLADHYASQKTDGKIQPHCATFSDSQLAQLKPLLDLQLKAPTYDHSAWFTHGHGSIPKWTAYAFAWKMIDMYLKDHPNESVVELANKPSKGFEKYIGKI